MNKEEIRQYHQGLINDGILGKTTGSVWAVHRGNTSNPRYQWKLHLFADGYHDWYALSKVVIPYLICQNATFKTVAPDFESIDTILQDRFDDQFGKAFTIYPNDDEELKKLAQGLDRILQQANLHTVPNLDNDRHNIAFEKNFGHSGRIFYRAERNSQTEYVSADKVSSINKSNAYNPYGLADPLANLIKIDQLETQAKKISVINIVNQIKSMSTFRTTKHSADNNEGSFYFCPKPQYSYFDLERLFQAAGIRYDMHFSNLMSRHVIRVLKRDMPYQELLQQNPQTRTYNPNDNDR